MPDVISGMVVSNFYWTSSGVSLLDTQVNSSGYLIVDSGGQADSTTVNPGGLMTVFSGAIVTGIVENGGYVNISSNCITSDTFVSNTISGLALGHEEAATVHSGTVALDTTVGSVGLLAVYDGGVASDITAAVTSARVRVYSGGKMTGSMTLGSEVEFIVSSGGILDFDISAQAPNSDPLVNDYSQATVYEGSVFTITVDAAQTAGTYALAANASWFPEFTLGTADTAYGTITVNGDALSYGDYTYTLTLTDGALNLAVTAGSVQPTSSGAVISDEYIVSSGEFWLETTINSGGSLTVSSGGLADITTVNHHGSMFVANGGTATNIIENGGYVKINEGGSANFLPNTFSGMSNDNGTWTTVHSGTVALDTTIGYFGSLCVYDGGVARDFSFTGNYSYLYAYGGKITGSMTITPDVFTTIYLYEGSIMDFDVSGQTTESSALVNNLNKFFVIEANKTTLTITVSSEQADGKYALAEGAEGFEGTFTLGTADTEYGTITVNGDALVYGDYTFYLTLDSDALNLYVNEEPVPPVPTITGVTVYSSGEVVSSAAEMTGETLQAGANDWMTVGEGGIATSTAVKPGGIMDVYSGGLATITTIDADNNHSATVHVYSGGTADFTTVNYEADLQVLDGGVANNTTVNSDGGLIVSSGGVANDTTLNDGSLAVDGGTANGITAVTGAWVTIRNGGVANGITAGSGTWVDIRSAAKVTGVLTLEDGAQFDVYSGGIVDFDISAQVPGAGVLVNDLSLIGGSPSYTITVDAAQANGAYALAGGADGFAATVTLGSADTVYGTITVNGDALVYGDYTYYLTLSSDALNLYVNEEPPAPPEPVIPRVNLLENGHSQILAWDTEAGKVGYRATDGNPSPAWCGVWEWEDASLWRVGEAGRFGGSAVGKDGILLYDKAGQSLAAWTDLDDPSYGYVSLCKVDESFEVRCLGDFDGNGFDDVVVCSTDGSVGIVSDGTDYHDVWHMVQEVPAILAWSFIGGGRFSSTLGQDSLLFWNKDSGHLSLWDNQGADLADWGWQKHDMGLLESGWEVAAIGDFAGDGIDDIVLVNHNDSDAVFIWDDGDRSTAHYAGVLSTDNTRVEAVGDYDGDGKEDLLLREYASGWGGLGYWSGGTCAGWTDLNASIETNQNNSFVIVA